MTAALTQTRSSTPWWLILMEGIALGILGLFLLTSPVLTTAIFVTFLGAWWLVGGIFDIVGIFVNKDRKWYWSLILGILGIIAGLIVLQHPIWATILVPTTLVYVLGVWALMMGIIAIIRGFQGAGVWSIILGVVDILIGIWLMANPLAAAITLPAVLGLFAIIGGIALIYLSFKNK